MKKSVFLLFLAIFALFGAKISPVSAQERSGIPVELRQIDAMLNPSVINALTEWQTGYANGHNGRYYQALASHTTIPNAAGEGAIADRRNERPTDQPETLDSFWKHAKLAERVPFSIQLDVYSGPLGNGYTLTVKTVLENLTYTRVQNFGPETWREFDWMVMP